MGPFAEWCVLIVVLMFIFGNFLFWSYAAWLLGKSWSENLSVSLFDRHIKKISARTFHDDVNL